MTDLKFVLLATEDSPKVANDGDEEFNCSYG
jgi:hypothetical protein